MLKIRLPRNAYGQMLKHSGPGDSWQGRAFERGARSYLDNPRVAKLSLGGDREERLEELMLMLAQTRASRGVLEVWKCTEGRDYSAGRDEYVALARELESLERGPVMRLRAEVEALSRDVAELEARLRASGGDPEAVKPPIPSTVIRPILDVRTGAAERRGVFKRLLGEVRRIRAERTRW